MTVENKFLRANLGIFILAAPIPILLIPSHTPIGGVPGLATLLYFLTGYSPGLLILLLNTVCLGLGFLFLGNRIGIQSIYASVVLAVLVEGFFRLLPTYWIAGPLAPWIAQGIASLFMGVGLQWAITANYPPAGTATLAVILNQKLKIPAWLSLWLMDLTIATATGFAMDWMTALRTAFGASIMYVIYYLFPCKNFKTSDKILSL